jgi:HK97 gp10 family phage protein
MTMAQTVEVHYFERAERELASSPEFREYLQRVGDGVASDARAHAPVGRPSQGGAAGIAAVTQLSPDGWEVLISWQRRNFYLKFHESGTVYMPARPFLVPALNRARGV